MSNQSQLDRAFQEAFCTDLIPPGTTVTCQCSQSYKSTVDQPQRAGEAPGVERIVLGCECDYTESFGGMMWRHRHGIARFLLKMSDALEADRSKLIGTVPVELVVVPKGAE